MRLEVDLVPDLIHIDLMVNASGMAREIVYNMAQFFKKQKEELKLNINITAGTSEATRVSKRLLKEGKESLEKGELCFCTPKGKKGVKKPRIPVDAFMDSAIRQKIREFKKECSSIRRL